MHTRYPALAGVCLLLASLMACSYQAEVQAPILETPDMDAYWANHTSHFLSGNLDAALNNLTQDAVLLEAFNSPVAGLETIRDAMERSLTEVEIKTISMDSTETHDAGSWLVDFGTYSETFSMKGQAKEYTLEGSYIAMLRRDNSGNWKVTRFASLPSKPFPPEMMQAGDPTSQ